MKEEGCIVEVATDGVACISMIEKADADYYKMILMDIQMPVNYYPDNDPDQKPELIWRSHANNIYTNWLNYYVYQTTPYDLEGTPF